MWTSTYIYSCPGFTKDGNEAGPTVVSLSSPKVTLSFRCVLLWFMLSYEGQLPPHSAALKAESGNFRIYSVFFSYPAPSILGGERRVDVQSLEITNHGLEKKMYR